MGCGYAILLSTYEYGEHAKPNKQTNFSTRIILLVFFNALLGTLAAQKEPLGFFPARHFLFYG